MAGKEGMESSIQDTSQKIVVAATVDMSLRGDVLIFFPLLFPISCFVIFFLLLLLLLLFRSVLVLVVWFFVFVLFVCLFLLVGRMVANRKNCRWKWRSWGVENGWNGKMKRISLGWRDGSVVKSTNCSSRGPEFKSQQPHGGSQPSVIRSDALLWCVWRQLQCTYI